MKVINYLLGYKNLKIYQDTNMFSFSLDSILLPNFVTVNKNIKNVLDIGCGNGVIPLILSTKTSANIIGVEIQKDVYSLAIKSIELNELAEQIQIINEDINLFSKNMNTETFDIITCNPPFFKVEKDSHLNKSDYKTIARHEVALNLVELMEISKKMLKNKGVLAIVHRPERMIEIIELMKKNGIEPKKIQLVYPGKNKEANILLIEGAKNGNPGLKVLPSIISHEENGDYTEQVKKYFE